MNLEEFPTEDTQLDTDDQKLLGLIHQYKNFGRHQYCLRKIAKTLDIARNKKVQYKSIAPAKGLIQIDIDPNEKLGLELLRDSLILSILYYQRMFGQNKGSSSLSAKSMRFDATQLALHDQLISIRHNSIAHINSDFEESESIFLDVYLNGEKEVVVGYKWREEYLGFLEIDLDGFRKLVGHVHDGFLVQKIQSLESQISLRISELGLICQLKDGENRQQTLGENLSPSTADPRPS